MRLPRGIKRLEQLAFLGLVLVGAAAFAVLFILINRQADRLDDQQQALCDTTDAFLTANISFGGRAKRLNRQTIFFRNQQRYTIEAFYYLLGIQANKTAFELSILAYAGNELDLITALNGNTRETIQSIDRVTKQWTKLREEVNC